MAPFVSPFSLRKASVQGAITFRVADPARLAARIDFTIDLATGRWCSEPLEQVGGLLTQLAQQFVDDGAWNKRLHPGWAAQAGMTAAALARDGFVGATKLPGATRAPCVQRVRSSGQCRS